MKMNEDIISLENRQETDLKTSNKITMKQVPLECDINIAVNGCSGFATSSQKGPFMAMLISHSRGTCLIIELQNWEVQVSRVSS